VARLRHLVIGIPVEGASGVHHPHPLQVNRARAVVESRERAAPRDLRVQVHQPQENGFMSVDGEAHPVVNLGRADQAQASQSRVEVHQVMTIHGVPMMVHGQIVHTMDG
jgi:hypothetical protein